MCFILGLQDSQFESCENKTLYNQYIYQVHPRNNEYEIYTNLSQPSPNPLAAHNLCVGCALACCRSKTVVRTAGRIDGWVLVSIMFWDLRYIIHLYSTSILKFLFTKGQLMPPGTDSTSSYEWCELKRFG